MNRASGAVDTLGTADVRLRTAVDDLPSGSLAVDECPDRPLSVLTPFRALTCHDARHPQFPHPLLLRRILSLRGTVLIGPGDDGDDRRIA